MPIADLRLGSQTSNEVSNIADDTDLISHMKPQVNRQSAIANRQCLGFRMFRPPLRALVQTDQGWPTQISAWSKQRSVYGKVVNLGGPWRTTGDWWRDDRWARDEWDVALESGNKNIGSAVQRTVYRVYRELSSGVWFVEGSYD